jgi:hypothetical protein
MSTPPSYGAPVGPQFQPVPPRRRSSAWPWLLGGCGGCALLVIVAMVVMGMGAANFVRSAARDIGPVDAKSVQQNLGEVPLYPGSTLNVAATQGILTTFRLIERAAGKQPGAIFRAVALMETTDTPDKVLEYYDRELQGAGWKQAQARGGGSSQGRQAAYQKGNEMVMVQVQQQQGKTMITLMRGGPEMADKTPPSSGGQGR